LSIDLASGFRRIKPERRLARLRPRSAAQLLSAAMMTGGRIALVLDTNVYIKSAAGTLPTAAEALIDRSLLFHCSVCVAELTTGLANAKPSHAGWKVMRRHYNALIATFPPTRVLTPDPQIWAEAGLIAGTLARTQNFQRHQRKECLNDALIFLTASRAGLPVLTANRQDFDLIQQLAPQGQFIHF